MNWAVAVSAISTAAIAVVLLVCGIAWLRWLSELQRLAGSVERLVDVLDRDARPALQSARSLAEDAGKMVAAVRSEVDGFAGAASDVRQRVTRAARAADERIRDLEALLDVVQYEVEETALDVAAALRTTRRGASVLGAMKRAFVGRGR